ncbi:transcription factor bHLH140 [Euphorbia lathyris]|uniref:transcription factor bHLH140 n=1 Tax=Euphorbia lathyris TaxID=212925 RepID=UPI00331329ED
MDCQHTPKLQDGEDNKGRPILVLLVGAPGSGKSTFCEQVMRLSSRSWARICQDTINNGKAGTKPQCLRSAASALKDGKSVFIDRCNLEREQRAEFVKLGDSHVDVHSVVLDLPAQLCISRSVKRTGHEGNLQGGRAAAVVNKMLQNKELPKLSEGFSRIMFCHSESDVQAAIDTYAALGALDTLLSGSFGQKKAETKVQLGIMKFLKKLDVPPNAGSSLVSEKDYACPQISDKKDPSCKMPDNVSSILAADHKEVKERDNLSKGTIGHDVSLDSIPTLAFASISTADFKFNNDRASDIIVEKVEEFVKKLGNARLVLVDLSHGSKILSLVKAKAAQRNIDTKKFFTFVGDITQLYSQRGLRCNVLANAANWRLKPGGGGVNAAIFSAAGLALEVATKERAASLLPGHALIVPLPSNSPLYSREGVTHIIHVLGPNMNPGRPNCLNNDYAKGCKILCDAYTALFNGFISILANQEKLLSGRSENFLSETLLRDTSHTGLKNNLANGEQKTKRDGDCVSERSKKCKGSQNENADSTGSACEKVAGDHSKINGSTSMRWSSWAQALYQIARHPEKHKDELLEILDDVVVLNDLYPKAQKHLLVLARSEGLDSLADVHQEHLQLLITMHAVGLKWAEKFLQEDSSMVFRLGYHSVPSMRQLHLHVISQDFNSNHLKNKKHWNSFNTEFFRDSVDVIEEIRNHGKAILKKDERYLSMELRCLRCRSAHPNIPRLKAHITNCRLPFPPTLLQNARLVTTAGS